MHPVDALSVIRSEMNPLVYTWYNETTHEKLEELHEEAITVVSYARNRHDVTQRDVKDMYNQLCDIEATVHTWTNQWGFQLSNEVWALIGTLMFMHGVASPLYISMITDKIASAH